MAKNLSKTDLEKKLEAEVVLEAAQEPATAESVEDVLLGEAMTDDEDDGAAPAKEIIDRTVERDRMKTERDQAKDQYIRLLADFDNFRKRTAREAERLRQTATESLLRDLLPILDNLDLALRHAAPDDPLGEGVQMVLNQFRDVLAARGVEAIPATGEAFDPAVHEALSQTPSEEHPSGVVIMEYQRGYRIGGYVLRPAKVVVSSGPAEPAEPDADAVAKGTA
jgi:molecular chaperone GrpE